MQGRNNAIPANAICVPPLVVSVFAMEAMPISIESVLPQTSMRTHVGNFAQQILNTADEQQSQRAAYGVPLKSEQFMCVSCVHPSVEKSWCLSQRVGEVTVLPQQTCLLNKQKTNLLFMAPSMQVKVLFCSQSTMQERDKARDNNNTNTTGDKVSQSKSTAENDVKSHIFTASLPLKHILEQLIHSDSFVHETITSEDNNKVWQMQCRGVHVGTKGKYLLYRPY